MSVIPCYRGGHHCKWPACPSDCDGRPGTIKLDPTPKPDASDDGSVAWKSLAEITHALINGTHYVKTPSGNWAPDYSHPDTAERVKQSVDEAYAEHWSIDRWRK